MKLLRVERESVLSEHFMYVVLINKSLTIGSVKIVHDFKLSTEII